jgi:hexaprenyl-diphosphate synthase
MHRWSLHSTAALLHRSCKSGLITSCGRHPRYGISSVAQSVAPESSHNTPPELASIIPRPDPYKILAPQVNQLRESLLNLIGSAHPGLTEIARYYFLHPSKQLRPLLVLLFSQATNGLGGNWHLKKWAAECEGAGGRGEELDRPLTRSDVLNDWNPNMPDHTNSFESAFSLQSPRPQTCPPRPPPSVLSPLEKGILSSPPLLLPTQMRLAQIVEMIHVASLLHDDVIDKSSLRRGNVSAPSTFGNKLTILGGDFLLGRASTALSRLGEIEVVELISSVIANLVEGEILQMKTVRGDKNLIPIAPKVGQDHWNVYLKKTYLKSASLMAKGARAAVVLGGCLEGEIWKEAAYAYGRNLGIAFQVRIVANYNSFSVFIYSLTSVCCCALISWWTIFLIMKSTMPLWASLAEPT